MRLRFWRRHQPSVPFVVAESRGAVLWDDGRGKLSCNCPFLCMAACEPCEFQELRDACKAARS